MCVDTSGIGEVSLIQISGCVSPVLLALSPRRGAIKRARSRCGVLALPGRPRLPPEAVARWPPALPRRSRGARVDAFAVVLGQLALIRRLPHLLDEIEHLPRDVHRKGLSSRPVARLDALPAQPGRS